MCMELHQDKLYSETLKSLNKFNRSKRSIFSEHNRFEIEISNRKISGETPKHLETK